MKKNIKKNTKDTSSKAAGKVVWISIFLYILFFGYINFVRYQSFDYKDYDLAIHAQTVWNILHGSLYTSILGFDFLGNHANFILFLIAPIYFVFQSPVTLLFIQTICMALAAYPLYLIAKEEINETVGLAIVSLYLLYPALGYTNFYEFHPPALAILFLSFMFYYFKRQDFKKFILFMVLTLLCQENFPLIIIPVGIYAFFTDRKMKWTFVPIVLGIMWFFIVVGKVIPYFNKGIIEYALRYSHMGRTLPDVVEFIISHPFQAGKIMLTKQKIIFMAQLFMPLSFFSLLNPRILIMSLGLSQHLLSRVKTEHTIYYHYTAELIPIIFVSTIYGIKRFFKLSFMKSYVSQKIFIISIIAISIISNIYLGPQLRLVKDIGKFKKDNIDYQKQRFIDIIPDTASVIATFEFLPKLSHRRNLYSFHHVATGFHTLSNRPYRLPEGVEYALLDFNDHLTFNSFYIPGRSNVNLNKFIMMNQWGVYDMLGSIVLLKRAHTSEYKLYQILDELPEISNVSPVSVNNELQFLGYDVKHKDVFMGKQIKLTLYWKALKKINNDYGNFIDIVTEDENIRYRFIKPICFRAFPTYIWQTGKVVKEDYNLLIPENIKDDLYSVKIGIFDYKTKRISPMFSSLPNVVDNNGRVNLEGITAVQR